LERRGEEYVCITPKHGHIASTAAASSSPDLNSSQTQLVFAGGWRRDIAMNFSFPGIEARK